jgi:hypothetical protein
MNCWAHGKSASDIEHAVDVSHPFDSRGDRIGVAKVNNDLRHALPLSVKYSIQRDHVCT